MSVDPRPPATGLPSAATDGTSGAVDLPAVAGVDGCRDGWVVATWGPGERIRIEVVAAFDVVERRVARGELALVAVDMPIGLVERGSRACDREARRHLGPRRSSVFPAPVRAVLACESYADALAASRAASGVGLPKQAWFLVPKIREVEASVRRLGPGHLIEVHPELAFAALAGTPMAAPKRSAAGRAARLAVLRGPFPGIDAMMSVALRPGGTPGSPAHRSAAGGTARPPRPAPDDVADACALAWSARRLWRGEGREVGGETDSTGLPMTISW